MEGQVVLVGCVRGAREGGVRPGVFSKKIVYSKPSNYGLKNYCVALSGPPLDLNDYSLAPPTRRLQNRNRTASTNG